MQTLNGQIGTRFSLKTLCPAPYKEMRVWCGKMLQVTLTMNDSSDRRTFQITFSRKHHHQWKSCQITGAPRQIELSQSEATVSPDPADRAKNIEISMTEPKCRAKISNQCLQDRNRRDLNDSDIR